MARHFLDTSALVKLYRSEPQTQAVQTCIMPNDVLVLSGIAFLEFQSAFFSLVRQKYISTVDAQQRIALLQQDLGNFEIIPLSQSHVQTAESLLNRSDVGDGLRPADALQLASAIDAAARTPLDSFVTTDGVLRICGSAVGLQVKP